MKTYLEPDEIIKLGDSAHYIRDKLLIRMLFQLGCRISEVLALEVKDVDFTKGTVTVQRLKSRIKLACPECGVRLGKSHVFCYKCGAKVEEVVAKELEHRRVRILPLDKDTLKMLRVYIECGGSVKNGARNLIFGINRHRGWQIVRECAERAGLPKLVNPETGKVHGVSPHRLRDAFAVHAMKLDDSGDALRLLQQHLGHASFDTTAKYRKVAGEELKALDKLFSDPPPKLIGMVRTATGDESIKSTQVKESIKGLWQERNVSSPSDTIPRKVATAEKVGSIEPALTPKKAKIQHPPVKTLDGRTLGSVLDFARNHNPTLKYEGMRTAIDVLTACKSPDGDDYDFHYDIDYRQDGVYIERKQGRGYRTLAEEVNAMRRKAGLQ